MFPTTQISQNSDLKKIVSIIAIAWITTTIISTLAHYKLAKVNKELAELQIAKLKAEGITKS